MNVTGGRVAPGHNVGVAGVSLGEKSLFYRGVLLCGQSSARGHRPSHSFPTIIARSEDTGSKPNAKAQRQSPTPKPNAKAQRQNHVTVKARTTPTPKPIAKQRALGPPQRHLGKRPGRGAGAARFCPKTRVRAAPGTNAKGLDVRVAPGTNAKVT